MFLPCKAKNISHEAMLMVVQPRNTADGCYFGLFSFLVVQAMWLCGLFLLLSLRFPSKTNRNGNAFWFRGMIKDNLRYTSQGWARATYELYPLLFCFGVTHSRNAALAENSAFRRRRRRRWRTSFSFALILAFSHSLLLFVPFVSVYVHVSPLRASKPSIRRT